MIVHSIFQTVVKKNKYVAGSDAHKEFIFRKTLEKMDQEKYILGHSYTVKGKKERGNLVYICERLDEVEWEGLKIKILEVWFPGEGTTTMYHPSDLKD